MTWEIELFNLPGVLKKIKTVFDSIEAEPETRICMHVIYEGSAFRKTGKKGGNQKRKEEEVKQEWEFKWCLTSSVSWNTFRKVTPNSLSHLKGKELGFDINILIVIGYWLLSKQSSYEDPREVLLRLQVWISSRDSDIS